MSVETVDIRDSPRLTLVRNIEIIAWVLSLIRIKWNPNITQNYACAVLQSNWVNHNSACDLSTMRQWGEHAECL
jgi:hypothetical protein